MDPIFLLTFLCGTVIILAISAMFINYKLRGFDAPSYKFTAHSAADGAEAARRRPSEAPSSAESALIHMREHLPVNVQDEVTELVVSGQKAAALALVQTAAGVTAVHAAGYLDEVEQTLTAAKRVVQAAQEAARDVALRTEAKRVASQAVRAGVQAAVQSAVEAVRDPAVKLEPRVVASAGVRAAAGVAEDELRTLLTQGRRMEAVQKLQRVTGQSLQEVRQQIEALERRMGLPSGGAAPVAPVSAPGATDQSQATRARIEPEIRDLVRQGRMIDAIKRTRELTGMSLGEAQSFVAGVRDRYQQGQKRS